MHHAQVAVAGLGRVHEERRRAGAGQRGGDLAAHVAALAHAHDDHAAAAAQHGLHRGQRRRQPRLQRAASASSARASISKVRAASASARPAKSGRARRKAGGAAAAARCKGMVEGGHSRRAPCARPLGTAPTPALTAALASTLELVLLYLVAAVLGVVVCRSLKLPPMLGYLVVGVLIGPTRWPGARTAPA
jgi:hypothetical protein